MAEIRPVTEYPRLPTAPGKDPEAISYHVGSLVSELIRLFGEYGFTVNRLIKRIRFGTLSDRPSAGQADRFYMATDTVELYYDDGSSWILIGAQTIDATRIDGSTLPTSDPTVAGELWNDAGTVKVSSG